MKPIPVLCLLFLTLATFAAPTNLAPAKGAQVELLTSSQRSYLYDQDHVWRDANVKSVSSSTFTGGSPVTLSWSGTSGSVTVTVKRLLDGKTVHTETTSISPLKIYNLEIGAGYEWSVKEAADEPVTATFYTSSDAPRLLKAGSMNVLRDIGGWTGLNGCKVRQNELLRGGPASGIDNDAAAKAFFHDVLGLKTELDFRGQSSDKLNVDGVAYVPLSRDDQYRVLTTTVNGRSGMSQEKWNNLIETFKYIFDQSKRPLYFHCSKGKDRTGITAALVLALLGVDMEDIWRDYQATPQSSPIIDKDEYFQGYLHDMATVMSGYDTFQKQVEAYFIEKLGFTKRQIEAFRDEMLVGYVAAEPGDPAVDAQNLFSVSPYVQHPDTNAMTIVFFTTKSCKAKVRVWRVNGTDDIPPQWTEGVDVSETLGANPKNSDTPTYTKQYRHKARFTGLAVHADYRYRVMPEGGIPYENVFRTLPDRNTPVRFIGYCDCETTPNGAATDWSNNGGQSKYFVGLTEGFASNLVHIATRRPDLITISGDLAAQGGYQKNWDEFWRQNAGVNAKGDGYGDIAGSIPILAAIGNHDLKDGSSTIDSSLGGEFALKKYLTYFEYNPNGVKYEYKDGTNEKEDRDMSQLFHREDLGPVTLIFLDTNKGAKGKNKDSTQDYADRPEMRAPDFHPGFLQYQWLTNNLADAQKNSKFTFVINHHCPYSVGQHNRPSDGGGYDGYNTGSGCDGESAQAVRCLTETMIRYGVDAWLCGHDEIMEHSQTNGFEVFPDGRRRAHTLNVYDLGSGGDGLRGEELVKNPIEVFRAFKDGGEKWEDGVLVEGGCHYGFMEVDVTTNKLGKWTCSLTPKYDFIYKDKSGKVSGFELRAYKDRIVIDEESNKIIYQEWNGDQTLPENHAEYVRPPEGPSVLPPPPYERVRPYVRATWSRGEINYRRIKE